MEMNQPFVYARTRNVKKPTRGTSQASGIDFYVPTFDNDFAEAVQTKNPSINDIKPGCFEYIILEKSILLAPGARLVIPSGIKCRGANNISLNAHNKSGISTKKGLIYGAEVVDRDYQGEIHISVINTSNYIVEIKENEKLIQFIQEPVNIGSMIELSEEELFTSESERGNKWQGSTDNK